MRIFKFIFFSLTAIAIMLAVFASISYTPPILKSHSIAKLTAIDVNGDRQFVLLRGHDRKAPVLLFLHGGPGMPAMFLAHDFQRELEKEFVVVHWDQRASGKSYRDGIDPSMLKISQLLDDAEVVIEYVNAELGAAKVWVAGHSHGSYLGVLLARRRPELVEALVTMGQVTGSDRLRETQDAFLRSQFASLVCPRIPKSHRRTARVCCLKPTANFTRRILLRRC
jgi:pimeloyl-ACP methyl ester carboxylesterase